MTTVNNAIFKAICSLGYLKGKWWAQYDSHSQWISLGSTKSGMCITFPLTIEITDSGAVELRNGKEDWAFYRHLPEEGDWMSDEVIETLSSVFEYELTRFISRYWARK